MVVERLEHKLGIRASDTATIRFTDCRVPKENLLGSPEIDADQGFAGVMQTFDNTRPLVAGMAVGCARAALDETAGPAHARPASRSTTTARRTRSTAAAAHVPADGGRLGGRLPADARGGVDGRQPQAELAAGVDGQGEGRPGRRRHHAALRRARRRARLQRGLLLEKWARDSKILDIFEGTQQIQQLIVARRLLNKSSAELK